MNYFPFHVGDYAAHTAHLEPMEDLAYRRLLDLYYLREGPLPVDIQATAKLVRMRSMAADVESVLREFFELTDDGWKHSRCDAEIEKMQDKQAKARASAAASVSARMAKQRASAERPLAQEAATAERTLGEVNADVELPTPTPTPTPVEQPSVVGASKPRPSRKAPHSFLVEADLQQWARENVPGVDIRTETAKFRDHTFKTAHSDWPGAWRNWMRRAFESAGPTRRGMSGAQARLPALGAEEVL